MRMSVVMLFVFVVTNVAPLGSLWAITGKHPEQEMIASIMAATK